jgi:putative acetyltransferase
MISVEQDDLSGADVRALIALHLADMGDHSPACHVYAVGPDGLQAPDVTVYTARRGGALAGMVVLKQHGDGSGEIKSMRTHPDHLRQGVAAALLRHLVAEARARGLERISLETGSGPAFEAALALYRRWGFKDGGAFGTYAKSDFNQFLHLPLE